MELKFFASFLICGFFRMYVLNYTFFNYFKNCVCVCTYMSVYMYTCTFARLWTSTGNLWEGVSPCRSPCEARSLLFLLLLCCVFLASFTTACLQHPSAACLLISLDYRL